MSRVSYTYNTVIHEKLLNGLQLESLPDFSRKLGLFSHKLSEADFKRTLGDRADSISYEKFGTLLGYGHLSGESESVGSNQFMYIKLGVFLELLNTVIPKDATGQRIFTFNTQQGIHKYRTITDHISVDPGICILPRLTSLKEVNEAITDSPFIVDIFISITHILTTLDSTIRSGNELDILTYLENILRGVEDALGGINAFELQFFEEFQEFAIVDRYSITPKTTYPQIRLTGTNSIVKEVNLVSKLSPSITAAIAISAQGSPYSTGVEATGFEFLNKGIEDSIIREKVVGNLEKFKEKEKTESIGIARAEVSTEIGDFIKKMYFRTINGELNKIRYSKEDTQYLRQIFSNYYKFLIAIENNPSFSFIVPFELQLTLDGISGLRVMEAFTIAEEILPYPYRTKPDGSRVIFMVTGLEHQVSPQGWDTKIKAQIFLDTKQPPIIKEGLFEDEITPKQPEVIAETADTNYNPVLERVRTETTQETLASKINRAIPNEPEPIKAGVLFLARQEQNLKGFNHNYYGVMADIGRWTGGDTYFNGSFPSTEGAAGEGVRTTNIRYFASFDSDESGIKFIANTLKRKKWQNVTEATVAETYYRTWLSPADPAALIAKDGGRKGRLWKDVLTSIRTA
jgi:hypothetical protein